MRKVLFAMVLLSFVAIAFAQVVPNSLQTAWANNGVRVRQGLNIEWFRSAANLGNGIVYAWSDTRLGGRDLYAAYVLPDGSMPWGTNGLTVDNKSGRQEDPVLIGTSDECIIFAWVDYTNDIDSGDVYAQKIDINGNKLWGEGGIAVSALFSVEQNTLNIVPDNNGGAFLLWNDKRNVGVDIYGMHLTASGAAATGWTANGNLIAGGNGDQSDHTFYEDGQNGFVLAYSDTNDSFIKIKRILADGSTGFSSVIATNPHSEGGLKITPDGQGNMLVAWRNSINELLAQKYTLTGETAWVHPVIIANDGVNKNPRVTIDETGCAFIAWEKVVDAFSDIYAQKINPDGSLPWGGGVNGIPIGVQNYHQRNPRLEDDGNGGCLIVWDDARINDHLTEDIYVQHVLPDGSFGYAEANGHLVCNAYGEQYSALIKRNGTHTFVVWGDRRDGSDALYTQVIMGDGSFALPEANGKLVIWGLSGNAEKLVEAVENNNTWLAWLDTRKGVGRNQIFVQKLDENGNNVFAENGIAVVDSLTGEQSWPVIATHPQGGVIVMWLQKTDDSREITFLQHIAPDGTLLWGANGVNASNTASYPVSEANMNMKLQVTEEGIYAAWTDMQFIPPFSFIIQLSYQKLSLSGQKLWGDNGKSISAPDSELVIQEIAWPYFVWLNIDDVYVIKLDENGDVASDWPADGLALSEGDSKINASALLYNGDLVVIWNDFRMGNKEIYGQYVSANGQSTYPVNGTLMVTGESDQLDMRIILLDGYLYMSWADFRFGYNQVRLQKYNPQTLQPLWAEDVLPYAPSTVNQSDAIMFPVDGNIFVAWEIIDSGESDIKIQLMGQDGLPALASVPAEGEILCDELFPQSDVVAATYTDLIGGNRYAVSSWIDARSSGKEYIYGVYAQKINVGLTVGTNNQNGASLHKPSLAQNYPNPFTTQAGNLRQDKGTVINFDLPKQAKAEVNIYNIKGQKVKTVFNGIANKGTNQITWNGTNDSGVNVSSGVYFYRLKTEATTLTRKMLVLH